MGERIVTQLRIIVFWELVVVTLNVVIIGISRLRLVQLFLELLALPASVLVEFFEVLNSLLWSAELGFLTFLSLCILSVAFHSYPLSERTSRRSCSAVTYG